MSIFYEQRDVPVHSVLLFESRENALSYPRGDVVLGFCENCGFITNTVFDPNIHEYSEKCEETQAFSPTFGSFHERLGRRLVDCYDLRNKRLLEIGCGKGEFLQLICDLGDNKGIGFDPAYVPGRFEETPRLKFVQDFYSEKYSHESADFVCCKMTLEHIADPAAFVSTVLRSIADRLDTIVFFQVPDVARILSDVAFWDIYYEHCSYFSIGSLARLFRSCGFEVLRLEKEYGDQYVMLDARPVEGADLSTPHPEEDDIQQLRNAVERFTDANAEAIQYWKGFAEHARSAGERTVLWGSGSKAVAFLSALDGMSEVEYIVDINPNKHGTYSAGTGQQIVPPQFLESFNPDNVIVMNPIYLDEIRADLLAMGLAPKLVSI